MLRKVKLKKGEMYGELTIIKEVSPRKTHNGKIKRMFLCKCSCGNYKEATFSDLRVGDTKSCGCLRNRDKVIHGKTDQPTYKTWGAMKARCLNKNRDNYKYYGGKGIKICKEWLKFKNFYKDMGDRPKGKTLDRIDNNKGYYKENCRWATRREQCNNRKTNHFLEMDSERLTIAQWSRKIDVKEGTLQSRVKKGWSVEKILIAKKKGE
jgi:hypothetical protein